MITLILQDEFARNAFYAGTIAAILASMVGYFTVIRNLAFAGHALGHIGFAGASGAGLIGLNPMSGQLLLTGLAGLGMGLLGERIYKSDLVIGVILAFSLGLGTLFLHFYTHYSAQAMSVLFGNLLGVSSDLLISMLLYTIISLVALAFIARPLIFASLEPELAQAKGISLRLISTLFMLIVSIGVTEVSQLVGILFVFTLLIAPAASALNWTKTIMKGLILTIGLSLFITWLGILLAFKTDWPIPFWISFLSLIVYLLSLLRRNQHHRA